MHELKKQIKLLKRFMIYDVILQEFKNVIRTINIIQSYNTNIYYHINYVIRFLFTKYYNNYETSPKWLLLH